MKRILGLIFVALLSINAFAGKDKGKVVFSNKPIDVATGESLPPATINVGEKIYCRVYLPQPLGKYTIKSGRGVNERQSNILIDGKPIEQEFSIDYVVYKNGEEATLTTFEYVLGMRGDEADKEFAKAINNLSNGNHKITLNVAGFDLTIATGEFTIVKGGKDKIKGFSFKKVKEIPGKKGLADSLLTQIKNMPTCNYNNYGKVLETKITSEWEIQNHKSSGAILGRVCNVAVLEQKTDGSKCRISEYCIKQQYNGHGFDKQLFFYDCTGTSREEVECD